MYPVLLKILACICMLADHIGVFTDGTLYIVLRSVGRISFPLFAFLLAQGYHHTHSKRRYLARLFLCGILSEVPYNLCFSGTVYAPGSINVLFTLSLGLCALFCLDQIPAFLTQKRNFPEDLAALCGLVCCIPLILCAEWLHTDYGGWGVLLIMGMGLFCRRPVPLGTVLFLFSARECGAIAGGLLKSGASPAEAFSAMVSACTPDHIAGRALFAFLALPFILLCSDKQSTFPHSVVGKRALQYTFYLFYPVHLLSVALFMRVLPDL